MIGVYLYDIFGASAGNKSSHPKVTDVQAIVNAAKIAVRTVARFLQENPGQFDLVEWMLFDSHTESVYEAEVDQLYKMI